MTGSIGIMGGTFDPIHYGHLILAEQAREQFGLWKVLFVTAADPPNKQGEAVSDVSMRYEMTCLAVESNPHFETSTIEMERPGPSYTVDTLRRIRELYGLEMGVYLLVGADEAVDFMTWRDPYEIQKLAKIVVANRPGFGVYQTLASLPEDFARNIEPLRMPGVDISSTDLRVRVASGQTIRYLMPESVEDYILTKGLYAKRT